MAAEVTMKLRSALFALFIAFCFDLPNPWWALLTVFFTSLPGHHGGIFAKAAYRVGGTLIGLAFTLAIVPNLVNDPELLIAVLSAWLGACLFVAGLNRTPRSYLAMLAGYTAILVGLPVIDDPTNIFDVVVARTEEIIIGVVCACAVHGSIFPRRLHDVIAEKVDACLVQAESWTEAALSGRSDAPVHRLQYATAVADLAMASATLLYETPRGANRMAVVRSLIERLSSLLPFFDAIAERVHQLRGQGALSTDIFASIGHATKYITAARESPAREDLALPTLRRSANTRSDWPSMERVALFHGLRRYCQAFRECCVLRAALRDPAVRLSTEQRSLSASASSFQLQGDPLLAARSGLAAAVAVMACGYLSIGVEWLAGTLAMGIAAVFASLFSSIDDPRPILRKCLAWTLISLPVGFIYVFAILPSVNDFLSLIAVQLPLFFLCAYWISLPKRFIPGICLAVITTSTIGLRSSYAGNLEAFSNLAIASVLGSVLSLATISIMRVIGASAAARRVVRQGWRDLAHLAWPGEPTYAGFVMRSVDRIALLLPRISPGSGAADLELRELRLGANLHQLTQASRYFNTTDRATLDTLRRRLSVEFRHLASPPRKDRLPFPQDIDLEALKSAVVEIVDDEARIHATAALTGLRSGLQAIARSAGVQR
jgi:uncharacterized membrane protein YccC